MSIWGHKPYKSSSDRIWRYGRRFPAGVVFVSTRIALNHVVPPVCRHQKESVMHLVCFERKFKMQLIYKAEQLTISLVSVEMATSEAEPMERMGATCKTMSVYTRHRCLFATCRAGKQRRQTILIPIYTEVRYRLVEEPLVAVRRLLQDQDVSFWNTRVSVRLQYTR